MAERSGWMEIKPDELKRLQNAVDYMEDAITDLVINYQQDANAKIRWMYEVKRVHQLATELINEIRERNKSER